MKYCRLIIALPIIAVFALLLVSCNSKRPLTAADELSKAEEQMLIKNAREILLDSKNFRFSKEERNFIATEKPEIGFTYTARKEGRGMLVWQFNDSKRVNMKVEGDLLSADRQWQVNVIRTEPVQLADPKKLPPLTAKDFNK